MPISVDFNLRADASQIRELENVVEQVLGKRDEYWSIRVHDRYGAWFLTISTGDLRRELPIFAQEEEPGLFQQVLQEIVHDMSGDRP